MKNAFITGLIIGILSGLWLFITHAMGISLSSPVQIVSVIIPFIGLYAGVSSYRKNERSGVISFLEALTQCFKIMIVGGVIAAFAGIVYINYVIGGGNNFADFSGKLFGALLVGILESLAISLILMNKSKAI
jgi:hypothetical protein